MLSYHIWGTRRYNLLSGLFDNKWIRYCKIICVFRKKYLFFGKNQDMTILIKKEDFYASSKTTDSTDYSR